MAGVFVAKPAVMNEDLMHFVHRPYDCDVVKKLYTTSI